MIAIDISTNGLIVAVYEYITCKLTKGYINWSNPELKIAYEVVGNQPMAITIPDNVIMFGLGCLMVLLVNSMIKKHNRRSAKRALVKPFA